MYILNYVYTPLQLYYHGINVKMKLNNVNKNFRSSRKIEFKYNYGKNFNENLFLLSRLAWILITAILATLQIISVHFFQWIK